MKKTILIVLLGFLSFSFCLADNFTIGISGFSYSPALIAAQVGDQVTIQASGMHPFVQVSQANWNINNPAQLPGGLARNTTTFTFTVTAAMIGTIYFGCENHMESSAMKGSITVTGALPIKLSAFSAKKDGNSVLLSWKTETEINTSRFEIEKSSNGVNFNSIGSVNAQSTSNDVNDYKYTENIGDFTTNFYRLKLIELSGNFSYSNVVRISSRSDKKTITISPNPVKDFVIIYTDSEIQTSMSIYNSAGKIILSKNFNNSTKIDASLWKNGVYFAKSKIDNKVVSRSFVVNHL